MVSLKLQKRLAASVLKCGRGKVWLDPNECNEISMANSRTLSLSSSIRLDSILLLCSLFGVSPCCCLNFSSFGFTIWMLFCVSWITPMKTRFRIWKFSPSVRFCLGSRCFMRLMLFFLVIAILVETWINSFSLSQLLVLLSRWNW